MRMRSRRVASVSHRPIGDSGPTCYTGETKGKNTTSYNKKKTSGTQHGWNWDEGNYGGEGTFLL